MAGIAFPLHQGYLLEGVSLTNDDIYSSSLQCYQRIKVIHYLAIFHFEAAESGNVGFSFARLNTTTETAEHTKNEQMSESTNMDSGEGLKLKLQRFSCCELNTYTLQNAFFSCHFSCTDMSWVIATQAGGERTSAWVGRGCKRHCSLLGDRAAALWPHSRVYFQSTWCSKSKLAWHGLAWCNQECHVYLCASS